MDINTPTYPPRIQKTVHIMFPSLSPTMNITEYDDDNRTSTTTTPSPYRNITTSFPSFSPTINITKYKDCNPTIIPSSTPSNITEVFVPSFSPTNSTYQNLFPSLSPTMIPSLNSSVETNRFQGVTRSLDSNVGFGRIDVGFSGSTGESVNLKGRK